MSTELIDMIVGIGGAVAGFLRRRGRKRPKHDALLVQPAADMAGRPLNNSAH